jgi:hypothetical protein
VSLCPLSNLKSRHSEPQATRKEGSFEKLHFSLTRGLAQVSLIETYKIGDNLKPVAVRSFLKLASRSDPIAGATAARGIRAAPPIQRDGDRCKRPLASTARPSPQQSSSTSLSLRALGGFIPAAGRACFLCHSPLSRSYDYRSSHYRLYAALSGPCTSPRLGHAPSCFLCHSPLSRSYYLISSCYRLYAALRVSLSGPCTSLWHLYKVLSSSPRVCAPLLRHPRVP